MKFLIILLFPITALSQSVSVSPYSFQGWGQTKSLSEISVNYQNVGVHYIHKWTNKDHYNIVDGEKIIVGKLNTNIGLSFTPVSVKDILKIGIIGYYNKFPHEMGSHVNFILDLGYTFENFRISYSHQSNGFGIQHKINPGVDSIKFTMLF